MAKVEGNGPNFDDLDLPEGQPEQPLEDLLAEPTAFEEVAEEALLLPADDFAAASQSSELSDFEPLADEPPAEEPLPELPFTEEVASEEPLAEVEEAEPIEEFEEPAAEVAPKTPKPSKMPFYLEIAAAAGVPLLLLVLAFVQLIYLPTAVWLIGLALIPYGIWKGRDTSIYTIFLGCVLAAILTAVYLLWLELVRYNYDIKARGVKQRVASVEQSSLAWHRLLT